MNVANVVVELRELETLEGWTVETGRESVELESIRARTKEPSRSAKEKDQARLPIYIGYFMNGKYIIQLGKSFRGRRAVETALRCVHPRATQL